MKCLSYGFSLLVGLKLQNWANNVLVSGSAQYFMPPSKTLKPYLANPFSCCRQPSLPCKDPPSVYREKGESFREIDRRDNGGEQERIS
jgi:hypothetical protein